MKKTKPAGQLKVLLVDDQETVRSHVRDVIKSNPSFSVTAEAANGMEAIAMVGQTRPDVVIMDVMMPLMNGIEATRKIKIDFPETPVIGISVYTDKRFIKGMLDAGAVAYILKENIIEELPEAIYSLFNNTVTDE